MTLQKTSHTFREQAQLVGIGAQASGSYVCAKFDSDKYAELAKLNLSEIKFGKDKVIAVCISDREAGKGGLVARIAHLSEDGKYVRYTDKSIFAVDIVKMEVITLGEFVEKVIRTNECATVCRMENRAKVEGSEITGFVFGSLGESYSALVYALNGKVQIKDIETRENDYNSHELVAIVDRAKAQAKAEELSARLRKAAGLNEVEAVEKTKKKTAAKKKTGAKAEATA